MPKFQELYDALTVVSDTGLCFPPQVSVTDEGSTIHISLGRGQEQHFDFDNEDKLVKVRED